MDVRELSHSVRTVADLADYFDELKSHAADVATQVQAESRGYFTTQEEDEVRGILVSYWKARCALFDLILTMRHETQKNQDDYPEAFVVAFSAALLLVDAARFLREVVDGRPTVRRKLNEGAPDYGVPKGVFDKIQKSLVSARHGWHLYHAAQYYEENAASLGQLASQPGFGRLLEIIERLKSRLDVSVGRFANAKLRTRGDQLMRRVAFGLFGRAMYGLQKLAGSVVADKYVRVGHQPSLPDSVRQQVRGCLVPGDVLVVRKDFALTNYFLPGYWPHAALYLGEAQSRQDGSLNWQQIHEKAGAADVLESMRDGVLLRSIESPFGSDSVVVLRPQLTPEQVADGLVRALTHQGKPYDFGFDFRRSDRLVCTEVVYRAYDGLGELRFPLVSRAGRPTLSGSDLISMAIRSHNFEPILAYAPAWSEDVVTDKGQVVPILERGSNC